MTEIERTKEADTPGKIPGRSGLQAERRTETSLSCGAHGSAAKKWRNIIMTLSMKEKKILYAFACPSHKIEARDLYNLVLKDIQELAAQAMKDADAFYQRLSSWMERRYLVDASQTEKERKRLEARNQEIDGMFLRLYTDKAKGILTEQRFMKLTAALEQESNQKRLHDLAVMQSRADAQESEIRTFIKEIRRYSAIEVLDEAVLNRLISKILIGEVKKVDGQKVQEVRIVYNFVGEIPEIAT